MLISLYLVKGYLSSDMIGRNELFTTFQYEEMSEENVFEKVSINHSFTFYIHHTIQRI